jgi:hypothetical protein
MKAEHLLEGLEDTFSIQHNITTLSYSRGRQGVPGKIG